jgi:pyroglutamyl-peptidase
MPKGVVLGSCNVLEAAGQGGVSPLYQTFQSAINSKDYESSSPGRIIWVVIHISFEIISQLLAYCFV